MLFVGRANDFGHSLGTVPGLFQGVVVCVHSDFRIGGLKPGERKQIRGKMYIIRPTRMHCWPVTVRIFPNIATLDHNSSRPATMLAPACSAEVQTATLQSC